MTRPETPPPPLDGVLLANPGRVAKGRASTQLDRHTSAREREPRVTQWLSLVPEAHA